MRRPRRKLEVNTFPFLAVLLCAMGSFILLLLVFDRRAKIVAQNQAKDDYLARKLAYESSRDAAIKEQTAKHKAAWQMQKDEIHAKLKSEGDELARELTQMLAALAKADDDLAGQTSTALTVAQKTALEDAAVKALQKELASRQDDLVRARQQTQGHLKLREQLTRDIAVLEAALRNARDRQTSRRPVYSLVPYKGKHGASAKPVYIEVADGSVAIHPGPTTLTAATWSADNFRRAIEERTGPLEKEAAPRPGSLPPKKDNTPYVLFLVRPSGIHHYYEAQSALRNFRVDFGYELVEPDWVFDFGDGKLDQQPWRTVARLDIEPSNVTRPPPKGLGPRTFPGGVDLGERGASAPRGNLDATPGPFNGGLGGSASGGNAPSFPRVGATLAPGVGTNQPFASGSNLGAGAPSLLQGLGQPTGPAGSSPSPGLAKLPSDFGAVGQPGGGVSGFGRPAGSANIGGAPNITIGVPVSNPGKVGGPSAQAAALGGIANSSVAGGQPGGGPNLHGPSLDPNVSPPSVHGGARIGQPGDGNPGTRTGSGGPSVGRPGVAGNGGDPRGSPGNGFDDPRQGVRQPGASSTQPSPAGVQGGLPSINLTLNDRKPEQPAPPHPPSDTPAFRKVDPSPNEPYDSPAKGGSFLRGSGDAPAGEPGPNIGESPFLPLEKPRSGPRLPALGRIVSNRDLILTVECFADTVTVSPPGKTFDLADPLAVEELANLVQNLVTRRQKTIRVGEPPYRPVVHFRVQPDGRRTYYAVYPRIAELGYPMNRENPD